MIKTQIKTGIIGCGNIGEQLAVFLRKHPGFKVCTLTDSDHSRAKAVQKKFHSEPPAIVSLEEALTKNQLVIESAHRNAVMEILKCKSIDRNQKKILFMSSGGLIHALKKISDLKNVEFFIPSGAIAGLDAIKAVAGEIESLQLTTTKPSRSLSAANFIIKHSIDLNNLANPKVVFEGALDQAVKGFPENINVAASLFLATKFKKLKINIVADPAAELNTHEIICRGKFGVIHTKTENKPSGNPKTSRLAILSAIAMLKSMTGNFHVGN